MANALVSAMTARIRELQSMVGPGWSDDPLTDPDAVLGRTRDVIAEVSAATRRALLRVGDDWSGAGADGAAEFMTTTVAAIDGLADRVDRLSTTANSASTAVARARERLRAILDSLEARAAALEPYMDSPHVVTALTADAQRSLADAVAVVEELQQELDGHAAVVSSQAPATSAPTAPAGFATPTMPATPAVGSGLGGGSSPLSGAGGPGLGAMLGDLITSAPHDTNAAFADSGMFGDGIAVRLPDGSTVTAPNAVAASAVRHALSQLGVPYDWGGTTPGVGLDCSGLTQWAYHEAGLDLPRLAQEQDVGAPVDAGALRPGDLAVWDGHVAMVVGNGTMIEAGDPVKLSPIRTTNAGQGFQGFWRPTG